MMFPRFSARMLVAPWLALVAPLSLAGEAHAAEEQPASLPASALADRSAKVASNGDDRTARDLYFRVSAGAGIIGIDMHPEAGYEDYSADGASLSLDLLVGTSPYRGAALGGALLLDMAPSMSLASRTEGGAKSNGVVGLGLVGPFFDAFPEPKWGLHLGASMGFAALSVHPDGFSRHPLYGLGGSAWAGNQFLTAKDWSMGVALRVVRTYSGDEAGEFDFEASALATSLMLTATHQ
jgi:hypothetical protein